MKNKDTVGAILIIIVVIFGGFLLYKKYLENPKYKFTLDYFDGTSYNPELIKKEKIKTRIIYEIPTDPLQPIALFDNGKNISRNKIRSIDYFDENGLCYLTVFPKYVKERNDTTGQPKPKTLEEMAEQCREIETNLPNGYYDSTFYFFDSDFRLVKKEKHKSTAIGIIYIENIQTYKYDKMNNVVQISNNNNDTPSFSFYFIYAYDDNGRIISKSDSTSEDIYDSNNFEKHTLKYTYNNAGLIATLGNSNYVYNEKGLIIKQFNIEKDKTASFTLFKYDEQGNCVKVDEALLFPGGKKESYLTLTQYDEKGLIKDKSRRHTYPNNKVEYTLHKFEYTY